MLLGTNEGANDQILNNLYYKMEGCYFLLFDNYTTMPFQILLETILVAWRVIFKVKKKTPPKKCDMYNWCYMVYQLWPPRDKHSRWLMSVIFKFPQKLCSAFTSLCFCLFSQHEGLRSAIRLRWWRTPSTLFGSHSLFQWELSVTETLTGKTRRPALAFLHKTIRSLNPLTPLKGVN